jgi:hypothetical protein
MSTPEDSYRTSPVDAVAGFLAACALLFGPLALAYRPMRLAPVAIVLGLIAAAIGGRFSRHAAWAVGVATFCLAAGTIIAVLTDNPIF